MDLVSKPDLKVDIAKGVVELVIGHDGAIKSTTVIPLAYIVDIVEKVVPGDQTGIAATLKGLFGLIP